MQPLKLLHSPIHHHENGGFNGLATKNRGLNTSGNRLSRQNKPLLLWQKTCTDETETEPSAAVDAEICEWSP